MKSLLLGAISASAITLVALSATADLVPRLGGKVVYDTDRDITWLADANLAASNTFGFIGVEPDGRMVWDATTVWIAAMNADGGTGYLGFDGWRRPATLEPDTSCSGDFDCTGSEMGHLFYEELGGTAGDSILNSSDPDLSLFWNIQAGEFAGFYWSDWKPSDDPEGEAWFFHFGTGRQGFANVLSSAFVWPVADGDVFGPAVVEIDIKPGDRRNIVNPRAKGGIWVAVLSDTDPGSPFDPSSQVDIPTVAFGPGGAGANRYKVKDINKDGLGDLLLRFRIPATGIACGDTEATLSGETFDDQSFTGTDSIKTVGCKPKKHHKKYHHENHDKKYHKMRHNKHNNDDHRKH